MKCSPILIIQMLNQLTHTEKADILESTITRWHFIKMSQDIYAVMTVRGTLKRKITFTNSFIQSYTHCLPLSLSHHHIPMQRYAHTCTRQRTQYRYTLYACGTGKTGKVLNFAIKCEWHFIRICKYTYTLFLSPYWRIWIRSSRCVNHIK
jgi:hypothetical protein